MKVLKSSTDQDVYKRVFSHLKKNQSPLVLWQLKDDGQREIIEAYLLDYDGSFLSLSFSMERELNSALAVYCYAEDAQLIFKTQSKQHSILHVPDEMRLLEDPEKYVIRGELGGHAPDIMKVKRLNLNAKSMAERSTRDQDFLNQELGHLSLEEEDKLFADKRETPRSRPLDDKWVKLKVSGHSEMRSLKLYDLSRGGLGFITTDSEIFLKDVEVQVVGFDTFDLDDPLIGRVVGLRPLNDMQMEWKIGIRFDEGQD